MSIQLDPRKSFKAIVFGDVLMILTWVNDERAMVLMPARRANGSPWFIIMEHQSWRYDPYLPRSEFFDETGKIVSGPLYLEKQAKTAAKVLGMDETDSTAHRIADIILNYLPDLIKMPSSPPVEFQAGAIGSMQLREDGRVIAEQDIKLEKEGVIYE